MTTFQLSQAPDVTFDAAGVSVDPSGQSVPVVNRKVIGRVLAETGRKFAWVKGNLAVELDSPGHVIEVLRPREDGLFDLGAASWITSPGALLMEEAGATAAAPDQAAARG